MRWPSSPPRPAPRPGPRGPGRPSTAPSGSCATRSVPIVDRLGRHRARRHRAGVAEPAERHRPPPRPSPGTGARRPAASEGLLAGTQRTRAGPGPGGARQADHHRVVGRQTVATRGPSRSTSRPRRSARAAVVDRSRGRGHEGSGSVLHRCHRSTSPSSSAPSVRVRIGAVHPPAADVAVGQDRTHSAQRVGRAPRLGPGGQVAEQAGPRQGPPGRPHQQLVGHRVDVELAGPGVVGGHHEGRGRAPQRLEQGVEVEVGAVLDPTGPRLDLDDGHRGLVAGRTADGQVDPGRQLDRSVGQADPEGLLGAGQPGRIQRRPPTAQALGLAFDLGPQPSPIGGGTAARPTSARSAWWSSTARAASPSAIGSPMEPTVTSCRKSTSMRAPQARAVGRGVRRTRSPRGGPRRPAPGSVGPWSPPGGAEAGLPPVRSGVGPAPRRIGRRVRPASRPSRSRWTSSAVGPGPGPAGDPQPLEQGVTRQRLPTGLVVTVLHSPSSWSCHRGSAAPRRRGPVPPDDPDASLGRSTSTTSMTPLCTKGVTADPGRLAGSL